jgi:hypothetical protein
MALAIGDVFEVSCGECGATLQYRVDAQPVAIFIGAPSSPVNLRPVNRQPGATFDGCPHGRDDCAGVTAALARLHEIPEYAEWRQQPDVAKRYDGSNERNRTS